MPTDGLPEDDDDTHGTMRVGLTGDPRSDEDVDRLLDLLVQYAKTWKADA